MNHGESGPASLVRRWLRGKERDASLREYPNRGMSGMEDTSGGEVPGGGVKTLEGPGASKPQGSGSGSIGCGSDIKGMPSTSQIAVATALLM